MQSVTYSNSSTPISYQPVLGGAVIQQQQQTNQVQIPNTAAAVKQNKLPPQILPKVWMSHSSDRWLERMRTKYALRTSIANYEIDSFHLIIIFCFFICRFDLFVHQPNISNSSSVITQPKNTTSMSTAQCEPNLTQQQPPQHQPTQPQLNTQQMQSNTQTPTPQPNAPLITTGNAH